MEPLHIAVRCVFTYVTLLALLRSAGKRTLAEGTAFDFVLAVMVGDLLDDALWGEVSAVTFVAATGTLMLAHAALGLLTRTRDTVRRVVSGVPEVLLAAGTRRRGALRSERVSERELATLLRKRGVESWQFVERLVLEDSGQPSVVLCPATRPVIRRHRDAVRPAR